MTIKMVVPTSLQMGLIEYPPYFFTVSETGRDVAEQYIETPVGSSLLSLEYSISVYPKDDNKNGGSNIASDGVD